MCLHFFKEENDVLDYLKEESNRTLTEKGAAAYRSSLSSCVDLFGTIGALRNADESVKFNESGTALISGCSPAIFKMVASGDINPEKFLMEALSVERYACIEA